MDAKEQKKLILNLICTSKLESGFVTGRISYKEAAEIYIELSSDIEELRYQYLSEYDGCEKEQIEKLEKNQKRLRTIIDKNIKVLNDFKPNIDSHIHKDISLLEISYEKLKKFCISFNRSTGRGTLNVVRYIECNPEIVAPLKTTLNNLGKARTKLNTINTVLEEVELNGRFDFKQEFESVPDACRFYERKLENETTRESLKSQIKKFAVFYEKGEELDWGTIDKRINSWVDHENSKPNKQEISHK